VQEEPQVVEAVAEELVQVRQVMVVLAVLEVEVK
jgi:hypothetical protein